MYDMHYSKMPMDAIVLDVNHFHLLNERYGKQYGDSVLSRIGKRVREISREIHGVCCRRGADTFFIYCPHREDYERILDQASEGLVDEDVSRNRVRLRMGVYSQVDKSLQIERRFDYAKIAANTVKSGYLKAVGVYDTKMHEAELYRERLLEDFRPSLESNRFEAICSLLDAVGADYETERSDTIVIHGCGCVRGGRVDVPNDHRMAMAAALLGACAATPIQLTQTDSVRKSYPTFWRDFIALGGTVDAI